MKYEQMIIETDDLEDKEKYEKKLKIILDSEFDYNKSLSNSKEPTI
jgi:hypothetical protein